MKITWYFDLISPFAYLALPHVEALARTREVMFRPVVFGALLAHWGQLGPAEIVPKRLHTYRLCQFLAERDGMTMRFPPRHPFRSLAALRLLAAAGGDARACRVAFDFVWNEGRDPSDAGELDVLRLRLGLPDDAVQRGSPTLRAWTEEAIARGVFGVPTLAIGDEPFWGLDAVPMALAYLDDPDTLARGEMARLASIEIGVTRART